MENILNAAIEAVESAVESMNSKSEVNENNNVFEEENLKEIEERKEDEASKTLELESAKNDIGKPIREIKKIYQQNTNLKRKSRKRIR